MSKEKFPSLRTLRERQTWMPPSIREVARRLGITPVHLALVEQGKRVMGDSTLGRLAMLYGIKENAIRQAHYESQRLEKLGATLEGSNGNTSEETRRERTDTD